MITEQVHEKLKRLRFARNFLTRRLVHTNLQLLYSCNFRCQICDYWKPPHTRRPQLSLEQVRVIAAKLASVGPQVISIGGGEPLLHPEIEAVVRVLARQHFPVMICNGWYVTPQRARALWRAGMMEISVSVDYADPERHDAQRGKPGAHRRALGALETLHRTRCRPDQRVHMISVILDDNLDQVEPLIRRCRELGITYLVTLYSHGRGERARRAVDPQVSRRLLELKARYPEFVVLRGYIERFSRALAQGGIAGCRCGLNLCNIDSQGDVSLCIDRLDQPLANILTDPMGLVEARLRRAQRENNCADCWTSCRGAIETLMYGEGRAGNLWDYYQMTRGVALEAG